VIRRVIDLLAGLVLCVLAAPFALVVAFAVWRDSPGPVLFRQTRVGLDRRPIQVWKFRTFSAVMDPHPERPLVARDPRLTRAGRWLRPLGLDELPQLLLVVRGTMSLVGPRPLTRADADACPTQFVARFDVKPGLTGPAQLASRHGADRLERLALDADYACRNGLGGDLGHLLRTPLALLGRGDLPLPSRTRS